MRNVLATVLAVLTLVCLVGAMDDYRFSLLRLDTQQDTCSNIGSDRWRRTAAGWEDRTTWDFPPRPLPTAAAIHPAVIASLQVLVSIAALTAFEPVNKLTRIPHDV